MIRQSIGAHVEINERIRQARLRAKLTLAELGSKCGGKSAQAVSAWESGRSTPSAGDLYIAAKVTGVTLDWLIAGEEGIPELPAEPVDKTLGRRIPRLLWSDLKIFDFSHRVALTNARTFVWSRFDCAEVSFELLVPDRSNEPDLPLGSSIVIETNRSMHGKSEETATLQPGAYYLISLRPYRYVLRKVRMRQTHIELVPANVDWQTDCVNTKLLPSSATRRLMSPYYDPPPNGYQPAKIIGKLAEWAVKPAQDYTPQV
jgi:transcriptional regulator with XRE-family HTH domain